MKRLKPPTVSRRVLIAAAATVPLVGAGTVRPERAVPSAGSVPLAEDPVVDLARQCLALHREHDRLIRLWGAVEAWLADNHNWFKLTDVQRLALPAARKLYDIDDRLEFLRKERPRTMRGLRKAPATSLEGVVGKLCVVAAGMEPDEFPSAYRLLKATISELRALQQQG